MIIEILADPPLLPSFFPPGATRDEYAALSREEQVRVTSTLLRLEESNDDPLSWAMMRKSGLVGS